MSRKKDIEAKAEQVALTLIKNNLTTTDARYTELCAKLKPYQSMLAKHGAVDEAKVKSLLKNGFRAVRFKVNESATDDAEVLRFLDGLIGKLAGMAKLMGAFS